MKQITVGKNEDGQRLDRVLIRLLPNAGKSFIFKMLRKKNIVLNGKKAEGSERLALGDEIKLFFSDETFEKMATGDGSVSPVSWRLRNRPLVARFNPSGFTSPVTSVTVRIVF